MSPRQYSSLAALAVATAISGATLQAVAPRVLPGESIQAVLDAHPGEVVFLAAGEHRIDQPLSLKIHGGGIAGEGTLIQSNSDADIIHVTGAQHVRIEGITLLREQPEFFKTARAIFAQSSHHLTLRNLTIRGNRASPATVLLNDCDHATIEGCNVIDYKTITIDDRMSNDLYRYAFRAIDGHGFYLRHCASARIVRNRVIETELRPTEEVMRKHDLGRLVDRAPELGSLASYGVKDGFAFIWHQGGGIALSGADHNAFTLVEGNHIENAAQAMDLHSDFMVITNNHATNCYTGVKVFHGSRGVIVSNNVIHRPGKYGIMLRPGSESWEASAATETRPAREENVQRGIVIANNVIADMGYGDEHWRLWNDDPGESSPVAIKVGTGPLPHNPRLMDLVIQGNIVYDCGRDGILVDGKPVVAPPRYKWAIWFDDEWRAENVRMNANILHPGSEGISNLPVQP